MIIVSGTLTLDPEKVPAAVAAMNELTVATLAEQGCVSYEFSQSNTVPGSFRAFEQWNDEGSLNAHFASEHMMAFLGKVGDLGVTGSDIWRYDVSASAKLM